MMQLTVPMMGLVDTFFIGRYADAFAMGGLAVAAETFTILYALFSFLQMGTNSLVANASGERSPDSRGKTLRVLARSVVTALCIATLLILIRNPVRDVVLGFIRPDPEALAHAVTYFNIRIFAAPATLSLFSLCGFFIGRGEAMVPFLLILVSNVINLAVNSVLVLVFDMGIAGVAYGTVIAQTVACFSGAALVLFRSRGVWHNFNPAVFLRNAEFGKLFRVSGDLFLRSVLLTSSFAVFMRLSALQGNSLLAANNLVLLFWSVAANLLDGFAFAAITFVGRAVGAGDRQEYREYLRRVTALSFLVASVMGLIFFFGWPFIVDRMTVYPEIRLASYGLAVWILMGWVVGNYAFLWDGIIIGSGDSAIIRVAMLFTCGAFLTLALLTEGQLNNTALWLLFSLFTLTRGLSQHILAKKRTKNWFPQP